MQITKQLLGWLPFLLLFVLTGCDRDEIDITGNTDFPPSILSSTPAANGRVKVGDFDIRVVFADGSTSPLQSATVMLMDSTMNVLKTVTKELSGVQDSLVVAGSEFNASTLGVGIYNMTVSVTDSKGQTTEQSFSFEISNNEFAANNDQIFITGAYRGWDVGDSLTLIGPNLWEIQGVDLMAGEWKLKNTPDFSDVDWGDGDCDGFMTSNANGNENTNCGSSGLVNIRFNDQSLSYSVTPQVTFAAKTMSLYLLGTFNDFSGSDAQFALTGDNTWELAEVELAPGDQFKMAEMPDFQGINYGDDNMDGIAQVGGSNIVLADTADAGFYSVNFNDRTLVYSVTFLRATYSSIGIIGTATPLANFAEDIDMTQTSEGVFTIDITLSDGEVKFRADNSFDLNWGGNDFPSGTAIVNGGNIPVTAGDYTVTFDINALTYTFAINDGPASIGLLGSALPGGFETTSDFDLIQGEDGNWSRVIGFKDGEVKFRADDDWAVNYGSADFPSGTGTQNGDNIVVTEGIYIVNFNSNTGAYSFTPASIGLIGTGTTIGDFSADIDMAKVTDEFGLVTLTTELNVDPKANDEGGQVKFRTNDDWAINWGGADFPMGTGTRNGDNLQVVTAGTYTVTFDVNTNAYNFVQ